MKILIVAPYSSLPGDNYVSRFAHLAECCAQRGHEVTLATGEFSHNLKAFHSNEKVYFGNKLAVRLVKNRAYKSHFGLQRILSIRDFNRNIQSAFADLSEFDVLYSAFPNIGHNLRIAKGRCRQRTAFIIDVQEGWPESFSAVLPLVNSIPRGIIPFARSANAAYAAADSLVAVSRTYIERAKLANPSAPSLVAYLGSEFRMVDTVPEANCATRLFYIGTLSYSYDLETVIRAVHLLSAKGHAIEFNIFGDGPDREKLQNMPHLGTCFRGRLPYRELESELRKQHIAVNSIKQDAPQSVTNKLCDYLALGCPILNSQEGDEVIDLVSKRLHRNYVAGDVSSVTKCIESLTLDEALFETWRADRKFSRNAISIKIIDFIEANAVGVG
jgi:glycosyltransferase involved in cell wall biosynthesis